MMKRLLISGFDPFGGETVNPSWEAVKLLPDRIGAYELTRIELPTVYGLAAENLLKAAQKISPDAILCVGQAGGRKAITPEVVGINLREASIADNAGALYSGQAILPEGENAYFSTLPVREMVRKIGEAGIPVALSYSAGAFVCNDLLYTLLHAYRHTDVPVGFVHVPYLPEQVKDASTPSLPLETVVAALTAAILALPQD